MLAVRLHTTDLTKLEEPLCQHTGQYRELDVVSLILDVQDSDHPESLNTSAAVSLFTRYEMQILSLRHTGEIWASYVAKLHLVFTLGDSVPVGPQPRTATPAPAQTPAAGNPTVLVNMLVRTGQQVYVENADLIVTGAISQGTELIADGNIHTYAPMRGHVLISAGGSRNARIFIHSMQAELVSVTGTYRNFGQDSPSHLHKRPVQTSLQDGRLIISAIDVE